MPEAHLDAMDITADPPDSSSGMVTSPPPQREERRRQGQAQVTSSEQPPPAAAATDEDQLGDTGLPFSAKRKRQPGLSRIQGACERCRTRKNKCDGQLPVCSTCRKANVPCIVLDRVTHRQYPRGHVDALEREIEQLRARITELEQLQAAVPTVAPANNVPFASTNDLPPMSHSGAMSADAASNLGQIVIDGALEPGRFVGEASGRYFGSVMQK